MQERKYYEAYEDRYRQVHAQALMWASEVPSAIVRRVMERYGIDKQANLLELGCGEGRDALDLMEKGYHLMATDISREAIACCIRQNPSFAEHFRRLDCVTGQLEEQFDFVYAVAVLHMLVEDQDRTGFFRFFREHLKEHGFGLICTMGDGTRAHRSDPNLAFTLQERVHGLTGSKMQLAQTSCRIVTWDTFLSEIRINGLEEVEHGLTCVEPDFPVMMYAVVKRA